MSKSEPYAARFQFSQYRVSVFWLRCGLLLVLASAATYVFLNGDARNPTKTDQGFKTPSKTAAMTFPQYAPMESQAPDFPIDPRNVALKKALKDARIDVDMTEAPLESALATIFQPLGVDMFICQSGKDLLENVEPVLNLALKNVSAYSVLKHIEAQHRDLVFVLREGALFIMGQEEELFPQKLGFYDVSVMLKQFQTITVIEDKARAEEEAKNPPSDADTGVLVFGDCFSDYDREDDTYDTVLGPILDLMERLIETINDREDYSAELQGPLLHLRASAKEHRLIRQFIKAYNDNANSAQSRFIKFNEGQAQAYQINEAWGKNAGQALEKIIPELKIKDKPFIEFINFIRRESSLNITLSENFDIDEFKVSLQLTNRSLKDALHWVLEDNQLTMVPYYEAFRIVPKDQNEHKQFQFKIYSIEDILYPKGKVNSSFDEERLEETIRNNIDENNWEDPATLQIYGGQIICYQTGEIFTKIDRTLTVIRANMARKK